MKILKMFCSSRQLCNFYNVHFRNFHACTPDKNRRYKKNKIRRVLFRAVERVHKGNYKKHAGITRKAYMRYQRRRQKQEARWMAYFDD